MPTLAEMLLPSHIAIVSAERCVDGETNDVYRCVLKVSGALESAYVKIGKRPGSKLRNEKNVLEALAGDAIPVARVIAYVEGTREVLVTEALPGAMIWDFIDPRRRLFQATGVEDLLEQYGESLGRIHSLKMEWPAQGRPFLYRLDDEPSLDDARFHRLASWVRSHGIYQSGGFDEVFVHGDLNTASLLIEGGQVSGVVDWEFAGTGWREYDLAWVLRARMAFLNMPPEREAILRGYCRRAAFDEEALRLCEVLNYLRFAGWAEDAAPREFYLARAMAIAA